MSVTARSGLRVAETPGPSSQTHEELSQEAHERLSKGRQKASDSDDRLPLRANSTRGRSAFRAQASNRPSPIHTNTGAAESQSQFPVLALSPSPRPHRGRYLGQVLGTGRRVLTTPSPRSVRHRPPTPYARRMSLLQCEREEPEEDDWQPSIVIGRSLGENLSRAETARRTMRQWEALYEHTLRETPEGAGPILEQLEEARRELDEMEMNEENTTPFNELPSTRQAAIDARLGVLNYVLSTAECPAEADNVRAAIKSYTDRTIDLTRWALFWGGRLVDTCASYAELCADRGARLDRYAREHGAGWLWYEPPLAGAASEGEVPRAMRSTWSDQNKSKWGLGSWNCTMGFRRVKAYVARDGKPRPAGRSILRQRQPRHSPVITHRHVEVEVLGETAEKASARAREATSLGDKMLASKKGARMTRPENYILKDDNEAPHLHFDVLLDSGATFPLLYESDLRALGVDRKTYPAQSATDVAAVNGGFATRLYEVRATITSETGESLVDPDKPVHPRERPELGAVVPVAVVPAQPPGAAPPPSPVTLRGDGARKRARSHAVPPGARLSGQLPFMACYVSVVPGSGTVWLGEDRSDVIGAYKFPGQRRLFLGRGGEEERALRDMSLKKPRIRFEHRLEGGGRLVDEEALAGVSEVRAWDADGEVSGFCEVGPRRKGVQFDK